MTEPTLWETRETLLRKGRRTLLIYLGLVLLISAVVITGYVSVRGTDRLPAQVVRFGLTAGLCWGVYRGSEIAKWLMVICLAVASAMRVFVTNVENPWGYAFLLGMLFVYSSFAKALVWSPSINAFLDEQRRTRAATPDPR